MARRRQDEQHEVLTPEVVQRLREATQRAWETHLEEKYGDQDFTVWDRYSAWLRKELERWCSRRK